MEILRFCTHIHHSTKISYPCSRKNTIDMIRQTVEVAQPMYDIISKASSSASDMSCKNISSINDGITINTCTNVMTPTTY